MSNIINTLDRYKEKSDPDLSSISTMEFAWGSSKLREVAPVYVTKKNVITDKKFYIEGSGFSNGALFRPVLTKPNFSTMTTEKVFIELQERVHTMKMDHRELEEDRFTVELNAMQGSSVPVAEALVYEFNALLQEDANYTPERTVDVLGGGGVTWTDYVNSSPLSDIRQGFVKFIDSAQVQDSDLNITLFIDPTSARHIVNSDEYKNEINARRISEPTFLADRLQAVLNRRVVLAEGFNYGNYTAGSTGSVHFDREATCFILYVENPQGNYSNIDHITINNSTFITGVKDLGGLRMPPQKVRGSNEVFHLKGNIAASWTYPSLDGVLEVHYSTLMYATVWVHDIRKLVRVIDYI